jgi:hypothetical protein
LCSLATNWNWRIGSNQGTAALAMTLDGARTLGWAKRGPTV